MGSEDVPVRSRNALSAVRFTHQTPVSDASLTPRVLGFGSEAEAGPREIPDEGAVGAGRKLSSSGGSCEDLHHWRADLEQLYVGRCTICSCETCSTLRWVHVTLHLCFNQYWHMSGLVLALIVCPLHSLLLGRAAGTIGCRSFGGFFKMHSNCVALYLNH